MKSLNFRLTFAIICGFSALVKLGESKAFNSTKEEFETDIFVNQNQEAYTEENDLPTEGTVLDSDLENSTVPTTTKTGPSKGLTLFFLGIILLFLLLVCFCSIYHIKQSRRKSRRLREIQYIRNKMAADAQRQRELEEFETLERVKRFYEGFETFYPQRRHPIELDMFYLDHLFDGYPEVQPPQSPSSSRPDSGHWDS